MQTHLYFCDELGYSFEFRPVTRSQSSNDDLRSKEDLICSTILQVRIQKVLSDGGGGGGSPTFFSFFLV